MNWFHKADIPIFHPIFPYPTGFSIKFEENEVKLTSLEKYKRISLKIFEEYIEYLKEQLKDSKITMMMLISQSYFKGKHRRKTIAETLSKHWEIHAILKKEIKILTIEEFKKFQRNAVVGVDLNSRNNIAYSIILWNKNEDTLEFKEMEFLKTKIKLHKFQEEKLQELQKTIEILLMKMNYTKRYKQEFKDKIKNMLKKHQEKLLI